VVPRSGRKPPRNINENFFFAFFTVPAVFVIALLATGCAGVQGAYKEYQDKEELGFVQKAKQACSRYGFKVDMDAFAQCVSANANAAKDRDAMVKASM
jgi:hypothetical protein